MPTRLNPKPKNPKPIKPQDFKPQTSHLDPAPKACTASLFKDGFGKLEAEAGDIFRWVVTIIGAL